MKVPALLALCLLCALPLAFGDEVLKPISSGDQVAALVVFKAPSVDPKAYIELVTQLQANSTYTLWAAISSYDVTDVKNTATAFDVAMKGLMDSGMPSTAVTFVAVHSLSGFAVQDFVAANPTRVSKLVLMGTVLSRKYRPAMPTIPVLTIAGELDGVTRITRVAEAYRNQILIANKPAERAMYPVVLIPGMSHSQFVGDLNAVPFKGKDLKAEISTATAQQIAAKYISDFLAGGSVEEGVAKTVQLVTHIVDMFDLEGYQGFMPTCDKAAAGVPCYLSKWCRAMPCLLF
eukprot:Colp12_sorted_trinity150504_noHs@30583